MIFTLTGQKKLWLFTIYRVNLQSGAGGGAESKNGNWRSIVKHPRRKRQQPLSARKGKAAGKEKIKKNSINLQNKIRQTDKTQPFYGREDKEYTFGCDPPRDAAGYRLVGHRRVRIGRRGQGACEALLCQGARSLCGASAHAGTADDRAGAARPQGQCDRCGEGGGTAAAAPAAA